MAKKVDRYNVDPICLDVYHPHLDYQRVAEKHTVDLSSVSLAAKRPDFWWRSMKLAAVIGFAAFFLLGGVFVYQLGKTKNMIAGESREIVSNFQQTLGAVNSFNSQDPSSLLSENQQKLEKINSRLSQGAIGVILKGVAQFIPPVKSALKISEQATTLNFNLIEIMGVLSDLSSNGLAYFFNDGQALINQLEFLKEKLGQVEERVAKIRNNAEELKKISSGPNLLGALNGDYLAYANDLNMFQRALDAVLTLLKSSEERHILLMFQNPSEIRPGGGFLGSYGDLTVANGQFVDLEVQDIYWPDHPKNFNLKLIPPKPLQTVTKDWGARDANWFFDFPVSARTTAGLLEASKIYKDRNISFDGVVALNINVLKRILNLIGPVALPDYDLTINADNFLPELQKEVEIGRDKQAGKNPKKILSVLAPILLNRITSLAGESQAALHKIIFESLNNKDIMIFAKDRRIEKVLDKLNVSGSVYPADGFQPAYLAVVNANIAGGKSDAYMTQRVEWWVDLASDGSYVGDVAVSRTHAGRKGLDAWYQAPNKDYLKIFTNKFANLLILEGNDKRKLAGYDYSEDYQTLPVVKQIEDSRVFLTDYNAWLTRESGKAVYGTWLITPMGQSRSLKFRYAVPPDPNLVLEDGFQFKLVFDKQSGVESSLEINVSAPPGFKWLESDSSIFRKTLKKLKSREIITLTLERLN